MFCYKKIFGGELEARTSKNQETEVRLKCLTLNKFIETSMPNCLQSKLMVYATIEKKNTVLTTVATK
jgi:hypothetical protein